MAYNVKPLQRSVAATPRCNGFILEAILLYDLTYVILLRIALSSNGGSGEPVQMCRLDRLFSAGIYNVCM